MKKPAARKSVAVVAMAIAAISAVVLSSARGQTAPTAGTAPSIGVFPPGPGGSNIALERPARPNPLPSFYDPGLPVQNRVEDVVSRLTVEEKVALMQMASPAIPRLGIAPYHWWMISFNCFQHDLI